MSVAEIASGPIPLKTDKDRAEDFKVRASVLAEQNAALMNEARAAGFVVNFNVSMNAFGQYAVQGVQILKVM